MSQIEKLESTIESLEVALKGWELHPECEYRTKMISELTEEISQNKFELENL